MLDNIRRPLRVFDLLNDMFVSKLVGSVRAGLVCGLIDSFSEVDIILTASFKQMTTRS